MWTKAMLVPAALLALAAGAVAAPAEPANRPPEYGGRPLDVWIKALHGSDANMQNQAVYAIAIMGPAAKAAVPDLLALLKELKPKDDRMFLRHTIARALGAIGPDARVALPTITALFAAEPGQDAALAVLAIGGATEAEERAAVRFLLLASQKCRISVLLGQPEYLVKNAARLLPHLIALLKDKEAPVRTLAAIGLGQIGPKAKSAVPALLEALKDTEPAVVAQAAQTLIRIDEAHLKTAASALVSLLRREPGRSHAVYGLRILGPRVAPLVIPVLGDNDRGVRDGAEQVLASFGEPVIPLLIETLGSEQPQFRISAAATLTRAAGSAGKAIPALVKALKDTEASVRFRAAVALVEIDRSAAVPAIPVLLEALQSTAQEEFVQAAGALRQMGPKATTAGPALRELLQQLEDRIPIVRCPKVSLIPRLYITALTLDAVDHAGAKPAIPALIAMLQDVEHGGRAAAAGVLAGFGADAREAVPALKEALKGDENLLCMTTLALAKIAPEEVKPAVAIILDRLKKQKAAGNRSDRLVRTLAAVGPLAKEAVPLLESMLEDRKARHFYPFAEALVKIDPTKVPRVMERLKAGLLNEEEDCYGPLDTIGRIAVVAPAEVTRALLEILQDPKLHRQQKFQIMESLAEGGGEAKTVVVTILTELSRDKDKAVADRAARQLKQYQAELAAEQP
jgi:HEAT repeat protein